MWNGLFFSEKLLQLSIQERGKGDTEDICKVLSVLNLLFTSFQHSGPSETGSLKILCIYE